MFKKITKILLILILVLKFMSPAVHIVSANEGSMSMNIVLDDSINQSEDDQEPLDLDVDGSNYNEDEVLNENIDTSVPEYELNDENDEALEVEIDDETYDIEASEPDDEMDDEAEGTETLNEAELNEELDQYNDSAIPQASIDAMYEFLENNSAENPFIAPSPPTFVEAINALDWGENITVMPLMSADHEESGVTHLGGSIFLILNADENDDRFGEADYGFMDIVLFVRFEDDDTTNDTEPAVPQASIDAMYAFLENNSAENPFIIPHGLTFYEAINALDWGENITVSPALSGTISEGSIWGALAIVLNSASYDDGTHIYDDMYWFFEVGIFVQYEDLTKESEPDTDSGEDKPTDGSTNQPTEEPTNRRLNLPQTGREAMNATLIGVGVLAVCGGLIYLRNKNKK